MGLHSQSLNSTTAAPSLPSFPSEFTLGLTTLRPVGGGKGSFGVFPTFPDSGIVPLLSGKARGAGFTARDNRLFLEAVFRGVGAGALWLDLSPCFGQWNSHFRPFRGWATSGVFEYLFKALSGNPDLQYALTNGAIALVHQKASGPKGGLSTSPLTDPAAG